MTNIATAPCTLTGFPEVTLLGTEDSSTAEYRWPLSHTAKPSTPITVPPNGTARFAITYLADNDASRGLRVTTIELGLPGDPARITIPWQARVLLQDAATHPGTYSGPFEIGS